MGKWVSACFLSGRVSARRMGVWVLVGWVGGVLACWVSGRVPACLLSPWVG